MKLSQYNLLVNLNQAHSVLYNTLTQDYLFLNPEKTDLYKALESQLQKNVLDEVAPSFINALAKQKFIVNDTLDEQTMLKEDSQPYACDYVPDILVNADFKSLCGDWLKILEDGMQLTISVNVNQLDYDAIINLMDQIPKRHRKQVRLSMRSDVQTTLKLSLFKLHEVAIKKGYAYTYADNGLSLEDNIKLHVYSDLKFKPEAVCMI